MAGRGLALYLALGVAGLVIGLYGAHGGSVLPSVVGGLLGILGFGEVTVHWLEKAVHAYGLRRYAAGVLVNSLAVAPELLLAYSIGSRGVAEGNLELVELAVLSVMVSAGLNLAVLGIVVLMGRGGLRTPSEASAIELPLLRAVVAAVSVIVLYALVEAAYLGVVPRDPLEASLTLLVFFLIYILWVVRAGREPGAGAGGLGWAPMAARWPGRPRGGG
ncbi:MAG TPA: hypothetical protein EYH50_02045 [Pyrodictium delaneyi]|uniref:Sodium/calcium exchanger membrane region domain-containing protein n=1 Tax=Pyrodictium delaneyi TaxID=1273541 RepID=A0A832ZSS4_9CREN|nr:hypothetical protein [Pyrodictium delaneyi]